MGTRHGEGSRITIDSANESEIGFQLFEKPECTPLTGADLLIELSANTPLLHRSIFRCHNLRFTNCLTDL